MKLSDFIKKYGDCEVTEEMKKCIKKKGKWTPAREQPYWLINEFGAIAHSSWDDDKTDNYRRDFMRIFKTREEAERYLEIMKACKEASFEPDWENHTQHKYYFAWTYETQKLAIDWHTYVSYGEPFYFESRDVAQSLIDTFSEKDIVKYVLGVEVEE